MYPKRPCGSGCMADLERRTVKCSHLAVVYHFILLAIVTAEAKVPFQYSGAREICATVSLAGSILLRRISFILNF